MAGYPGQFGNVLITKSSFDKFINTMVGVPVIINHKDITIENADDERIGVVSSVWYDEKDGWFWCEGVIWDETAQNLITDKGWSVSCSYDVKLADDAGGTENNIPYDMEFLDGVFTHLAIVDNPRYERANIVFNSKTEILNANFDPNQKRNECGQWVKDDVAIQKKKDALVPVSIKGEDIPKFETKKDLSNWVKDIFKELESVDIIDTGANVILTGSSANRETSKMRSTREENKAVFQQFKEVVEKSIKTDERKADEGHIHDQDLYFNKIELDGKPYDIELAFDYLDLNKEFRYAGHKVINSIKIAPSYSQSLNELQATGANNSITLFEINFNPNSKDILSIDNAKEQEMTFIEEVKKLIAKAENSKGEDMTVENEKVDKRKLIDEVGGILKDKVSDEIIRTIIGKIEKVAYDKSEAGTADNEKECDKEGKKVENETKEDEKKVEELKKDVKEDVENKKKCDNSVDNSVDNSKYFDKINEIYNSAQAVKEECLFVSREEKLNAANEYFAR